MQTVLSKSGLEVCYPCTVHLLHNGENFDCEYKSDHIGRDLLDYICKLQNISDTSFWGLKFMDTTSMDEQRYWLDLDKLIRSQVRTVSPRFYFRVKVYPPEPYKITQPSIRHAIFQQLRLDLLSGRLFCNVKDASMLVALILQHVHGNFSSNVAWIYMNYMKERILRRERCSAHFYSAIQTRALGIYENLLKDLKKVEIEDMFLRLACKLESYGVEPFLMKNIDKTEVVLWINYAGMCIYEKKKRKQLSWAVISKVTHDGKLLFIHLAARGVVVLECINFSECNYLWSIAVDHLLYFTSIASTSVGVNKNEDKLSQITNYLDSSGTEHEDDKTRVLKISDSVLRLLDLDLWKTHLSVIYAILVLYVMGSQTTVFSDLPCLCSVKNFFNKFVSKLMVNKMLTL